MTCYRLFLGVNPEGCKQVSLITLGKLQCLRPTQSRRCARLWGSRSSKSRRCARLWGSAPHRGEVPRCPVLLLPPRGKALSPTTAIHVAFGAARRAAAAEATPVVCCDRGSGLRPRALRAGWGRRAASSFPRSLPSSARTGSNLGDPLACCPAGGGRARQSGTQRRSRCSSQSTGASGASSTGRRARLRR